MDNRKKGLSLNARSYFTALAVIFALMVLAYILTLVIPSGVFATVADENGNMIVDTAGGFTYTEGGIPFWKWLLSPVLVLGAPGSATLIAVIAFLLVIGGIFAGLEACGLMQYMLRKISSRFAGSRYRLLAAVTFFFMFMGAAIGSFEECVPMVPIAVALAVSLGWDAVTGIGMCILAAGCGFASGVCNPFTVGVAQQLAGLPMFSGLWLRLLSFLCIYALLFGFLLRHAKKVALPVEQLESLQAFEKDPSLERGLKLFAALLGTGILLVLFSGLVTALQDYTLIIVAVMFLAAGVSSCLVSGMTPRVFGKTFLGGLVSILPAVLMILMASSIKYILEQAQVLNTIVYLAVGATETLPRWAVILFIYLIVLVMNFFVASGSAKAFMLIPLIVPIAQVFGISSQLCVVAYAFGDGFSNVFYPTNAALLISLGLTDVSYGEWVRHTWKFQAMNLILTSALLLLGLAAGY